MLVLVAPTTLLLGNIAALGMVAGDAMIMMPVLDFSRDCPMLFLVSIVKLWVWKVLGGFLKVCICKLTKVGETIEAEIVYSSTASTIYVVPTTLLH